MRWSIVASGLAAACVVAGAAWGQEEASGSRGVQGWFSGNVAVQSDYLFRGISQTSTKPAIQGGLDLVTPMGPYVGIWGSSVNFSEDLSAGQRAQMEMDVYGGVRKSLAGVVDVDLGAIGYLYPGAAGSRHYDFLEVGLGLSRNLGPVGATVSAKYSPNYFAHSGDAEYVSAQLGLPISRLTLSGSVGHQLIENNAAFGTPDYTDFGAGVGVAWAGFNVSGKVLATDLEEEECFGGSNLCKPRFVFAVARAM
jgi:uncharacterized protein (TIGR02001 family)